MSEHAPGHDALVEEGRRLASRRENLIAAGIDPAELAVPVAPDYSSWCGDCCPECGWHKLHTAWCSQAERVTPPEVTR